MGKNTRPIPDTSGKRILENAGAKRVSAQAAKEMATILLDMADDISRKAIELAKHGKRKTVQKKDILLASKMMK